MRDIERLKAIHDELLEISSNMADYKAKDAKELDKIIGDLEELIVKLS